MRNCLGYKVDPFELVFILFTRLSTPFLDYMFHFNDLVHTPVTPSLLDLCGIKESTFNLECLGNSF